MVALIPANEDGECSSTCMIADCQGAGSMLKCSYKSCKNILHVACTNFKSDEEAKTASEFFCSSKCRSRSAEAFKQSTLNETKLTVERYEKRIEAQKAALTMAAQRFSAVQTELNQCKAELAYCQDKIKTLEQENKRLENELMEIQNQSVMYVESQKQLHDNIAPKAEEKTSEQKALETLFELEPDEEFKRRLTEVFMTKVAPAEDRRESMKKTRCEIENMSETQKLAYYQRLHVQRMEAPKLMKFEGDPAKWLSFKANYERMKEKGEYDNEAMIEKLREALCGEAEVYVRQRLNQPYANADNILDVLRRKFFQPKEALAKALGKLEGWHQIPDKNRKELEAFLFEVDNYIYLCENLDFRPELEVAINSRITSKLPYNVETRWCTYIHDKGIKGTFRELSEFMWSFVPNLPVRPTDSARNDNMRKAKVAIQVVQPGDSSKSFSSKKSKKEKFPLCWYCANDKRHYLSRCDDFRKLSFDEKAKFLISNKICARCLASNQHASVNCPLSKTMKCNKPNCVDPQSHCTIMHPNDNPDRARKSQSSSSSTTLHVNHNNTTLFKVVPIYVIDGHGRRIETTLLMDRAAGASLVTREFFNKLSISGEPYKLELSWLQPNATHNNSNAVLHDLTIAPKHDPDRLIKLHGMYAMNNVSLPTQEQNPDKLKSLYPFLRDAEIPGYDLQRPQILLGLPHAKWMVSLETLMDFTDDSSPIAEKTPLGWTICGGMLPHKSIFHVCEVPEHECQHDVTPNDEAETLEELHALVKRFNSFEMLGLTNTQKRYLCRDDERAVDIQNATMKRVGNRYEIGLYWNNDNCSLPDNYSTALKRLKSTETRLKQLGMVEWANDHHKLLRDMGFVREATQDDINPTIPHKRINYVIGFVTFNTNKQPPKPRWVVDTASKHNGISLNSVLLKGPDNLIPLTQALFHFRERKVAMVSDVTKMYHQVLIKKEDQQAQRFLWRDCDNTKEPKIYVFQSMLFGPTCSPSQANAIRIDHAEKSSGKYPLASRIALNSMYMDDAFNSEDTIEDAVTAANETIEMFKEISWEMVSFRSNSRVALKQLPLSNVDDDLLVDLSAEDDIMARKVLGLVWNVKKDVFVFKMTNNHELISLSLHDNYHPTKKEVLSFIMKIFDCLGLISHFHIRGKMILQSIWRRGIAWEQHIPDDIHESWQRWLEKFEEIERLEIPRHYGYNSKEVTNISLHVFVDASMEAYAAVAYFRYTLNGVVHVAQVMSKCRVAPVKYASVPRLELMAAVIGTRIANTIKMQHPRLKVISTTFWSDSITVLRWLYAPHIRLQQFVAPRVSEIQETTNVNDWRYVPTDENVADDGTKWNDIDFSSPDQRWLKGPGFLYKSEDQWPLKFPENVQLEATTNILVASNDKDENSYHAGIFESISPKCRADWKTYRAIVGWVLRFTASLIARIRGKQLDKKIFLDVDELYHAENVIFKRIQKETFKTELINLTKGREVNQSSKLFSLNPFLDNDGLIRARTRMYMEDTIPYDMKCPPILPNKHETVHAFLQHMHVKNKHIGIETTIAEARSRAWIVHVRKAVKRVKHQCLYCTELRAKHQTPNFAPLPKYRLDSTSKPFEHCGVDCCGPFTIYTGLSRHKRDVHVVVFTCMVTRAVYLRKLDHLSADEMLLAVQDVWTRRGPIRHMYSDNGRNFLGVANIIKSEHHKQLAAEKQIKWHFSPALTPHWGGIWERLIKDIKRAMKVEMSNRILPEKVFECVLLQTEDIMNNRPLTHIPVSPDDLSPLTPNHLMKLHPGYAFVGGNTKPDDESSRYYTIRARKISEQLMKKWLKEYLPIITKQHGQKKQGQGLKIDDYVIYTDPTVKPSEWQRGRVINVYTGRDGIARVADVRLLGGNIIERRSVTRLAKLDIDAKSFGENITVHENSNLGVALENVTVCGNSNSRKVGNAAAENVNKTVDLENSKICFISRAGKKMELGQRENDKLILGLGGIEFVGKDDIYNSKMPFLVEFRKKMRTDKYQDWNNKRTVKINRIPPEASLYEVIREISKLNWTVSRIIVDSAAQEKGFFAFVTFGGLSDIDEAMNRGTIEILRRNCKLTRPSSGSDIFDRNGYEFGGMKWTRDDDYEQFIMIARRQNTQNVGHAVLCLNNTQYIEYLTLKVLNDDEEPVEEVANIPEKDLKGIIVTVNERSERRVRYGQTPSSSLSAGLTAEPNTAKERQENESSSEDEPSMCWKRRRD